MSDIQVGIMDLLCLLKIANIENTATQMIGVSKVSMELSKSQRTHLFDSIILQLSSQFKLQNQLKRQLCDAALELARKNDRISHLEWALAQKSKLPIRQPTISDNTRQWINRPVPGLN